ncbi:MAG: zinc-dependent metalloprotease [Chloroflexi bacterium]|nr:zinc-dependent metalloprotease [Chloroflexota bacterium]GIW11213.1 MAG: hypothetical protein KatS3mg061_2270 [Dehalococcoidia bacterium]
MIDWELVRLAAYRAAGTNWLEVGPPLARLQATYQAYVAEAKDLIAAFTGWPIPSLPDTVEVADREAWIEANISQFRRLFEVLRPALFPDPGPDPLGRLVARVGLTALSLQVGVLLGFLSRRVLGQFDVAFFGPPQDRRVLFVEPNIQRAVQTMQVNVESFRFYLALHETTHIAEFTAHPWLSDYLMDLLRRCLTTAGGETLASVLSRLVSQPQEALRQSPLTFLLTDEQRALVDQIQAAMSLIEGYGDYVMHQLAPRRLPDAAEIDRKFAERRQHRTPLEQLLFRLTGLDLKLAQYAAGERFVAAVVAAGGPTAIQLAWRDPASLPTLTELREPARWLARMAIAPAGRSG